jgi:hypothetical protein
MAMRPVTDHASQAVRINPEHVTHVICYTDPCPPDQAIPERMLVGLVSGVTLTFCYRTADAARLAAGDLDTPRTGPPSPDQWGLRSDLEPAHATGRAS